MNRILLEPQEVTGELAVFGGERAVHVLDVLHGTLGQTLKTGVIDGRVGHSEIVAIDRTPKGPFVTVRVHHDETALEPWVDVLLAPPRPRVFKRLLPQLAAMGVGRLVLIGAEKVEKAFWGATVLKPENYRPLFVDGLMQAGTARLPTLELRRNFRRYLEGDFEREFPSRHRVVAHPYAATAPRPVAAASGRLILAIGPEGGWTDAEVAALEAHGFARHSLGPRILRTDTATVALLAQLSGPAGGGHQACRI